jgi:hypothetical protein
MVEIPNHAMRICGSKVRGAASPGWSWFFAPVGSAKTGVEILFS